MLEKSRGFWYLPEGFWRLPTLKEMLIIFFLLAVFSAALIISGNSDQIMQGNSYKSRALKEIINSLNTFFIAFLGWRRFFDEKESRLSKWFFGIGGMVAFSYSIWNLTHYLPTLLGGK